MKTLQLQQRLVNDILTQAQQSPEAEICGLIAGKDSQASHCYPVANDADNPVRRYIMNPQGQIDAMRQIREAGEDLIAIYHSHPQAPAQPSTIDIAEANYPDVVYLIISLNIEGVLEIQAFQITNNSTIEIALELI